MSSLLPLVRNETIKVWKKKRFFVVILVLLVLIPVFTYAQMKVALNNRDKFDDWRLQLQQKITDYQNQLSSDRIPEEWKQSRRIAVQQLQYYLDHDVNPDSPNAVTFSRSFVEASITMFIPLLVLAVASDLVSGERSTGTIKMLLTRPVRRWKILLSKLIALTLYVSLTLLATIILSYLISGIFFGYGGWTLPVFTGFVIQGSEVDSSAVHAVPQWYYLFMSAGLTWLSAMTIACLALMVSVLVRSTAASIVTMMAAIIAGSILTNMASSWHTAKYIFSVNLDLTNYLAGSPPPIEGMSLLFSVSVLAVWAVAAIIVSFSVFTKQDMLN
ncbi:ABC-2 type transport system permease protein [Paenibacillus cellulosilyticus]|uniref:ABC-2 type transport system permease protein n=1 Tax=Paenibacillus cellulosilyticus TaxID=375489 RepID=A0A2V2YZN9_9BACL|nr:ABC transporter permease [Paenibacillus cellulosilyticus]PWW05478.1 ABC-2 type transport system permease protein [Paenibacillus cellulosilyticus]QKS45481.1 ABC transporter permease [Paenibacillus cellulosilyticus]